MVVVVALLLQPPLLQPLLLHLLLQLLLLLVLMLRAKGAGPPGRGLNVPPRRRQ